ncbi:MAG: putative siderophore transport system ATP-binding protein YusV [Myxococcota bacterium]|nr:putative siderophore transport system ATP-binding protein YusV [Myxococcota bacterium]
MSAEEPVRHAIAVKDLSVRFDGAAVLDRVSFMAPPGRITAIIGPNGAGKSTLLRAVAGLVELADGDILVGGQSVSGMAPRERSALMAWLPQEQQVDQNLTVHEFVALGRTPFLGPLAWPGAGDQSIMERCMRQTRVFSWKDRPLRSLSGGERQRVYIAMVLAQQTPVLLLDEPSVYLDIRQQAELWMLIRSLSRDESKTIVAVMHDLNLAARVARHVVLLSRGRAAAAGTTAETLTAGNLREAFGCEVRMLEGMDGNPLFVTPLEPAALA